MNSIRPLNSNFGAKALRKQLIQSGGYLAIRNILCLYLSCTEKSVQFIEGNRGRNLRVLEWLQDYIFPGQCTKLQHEYTTFTFLFRCSFVQIINDKNYGTDYAMHFIHQSTELNFLFQSLNQFKSNLNKTVLKLGKF